MLEARCRFHAANHVKELDLISENCVFQLANDNVLKQNIGVSAAFLSEIKPQSAGANSLSYNLTSDMMECIFRTYPQG